MGGIYLGEGVFNLVKTGSERRFDPHKKLGANFNNSDNIIWYMENSLSLF